jgi:two-component sensor histidine kinase
MEHFPMPISRTNSSDLICGLFKSAIGGYGMPLRQLFGAQLAAFSKQIDIQGAEVVLDMARAINFAALVNELAVNAAKIGALSLPRGKVSLKWFIEDQNSPTTFRFLWEETGGPRIVSTEARFGQSNVEEMARELGKSRIDFVPGELRFELVLPLDEVSSPK